MWRAGGVAGSVVRGGFLRLQTGHATLYPIYSQGKKNYSFAAEMHYRNSSPFPIDSVGPIGFFSDKERIIRSIGMVVTSSNMRITVAEMLQTRHIKQLHKPLI